MESSVLPVYEWACTINEVFVGKIVEGLAHGGSSSARHSFQSVDSEVKGNEESEMRK
jgi:hypothetical protein